MSDDAVTDTERAPGLADSLRALAGNTVAIVHTRLELLSVEFEEEKAHLAQLLLIAALALLCFCLGVVFIALLVVVAFWDTPHRIAVTGLTAGVLLTAAVALWLLFRSKRKAKPPLFAASIQELVRDRDELT